jgi:tetratricopeptide (TPR) repeat protein
VLLQAILWIWSFKWLADSIMWIGDRAKQCRLTRVERGELLNQAETLLLDEKPGEAAPLLEKARRETEKLQGPDGPSRRARWHLAWGYCRGSAGALEEAWNAFQSAAREAAEVGDSALAPVLRLRAQVELASVALAAAEDRDRAAQHARWALELAPDVVEAHALGRLAWLLHALARAEHSAGRWDLARAHFEEAVRIGTRVPPPPADSGNFGVTVERPRRFWVAARTAAAAAVLDLARTLSTLGDAEGCRQWFDRGLAALEGPDDPALHHARATLCLERARCEPGDELSAPARRVSWLDAAVREGLACGRPDGRALACRAGLELSGQLRDLGDPAKAALHARQVREDLKELPAEIARTLDVEALLALGMSLHDAGADEEAARTMREALELGRGAATPEARQYAALAAWRLHAVLLEDRRTSEAGPVLAALQELVPGLAAESRPFFVALTVYLRGITSLCEGRGDAAQAELRRAEAGAARLNGGAALDLARSAAAGLGNAALEDGAWQEAEEHFRRALATPPGDGPPARQQATRADLLLGQARAVVALERDGEALVLIREAFQLGVASGCSLGRKVAAHAALLEGSAPMLPVDERRRRYQTAARLGRLSGLAQGRAIAKEAEARLADPVG